MEFILAFVFVLFGLTTGQFNLIILHTNDVHSRIEQATSGGGQCSDSKAEAGQCYGGVARAYTYIQQIRANNQHVLLLDAGDQFQGTTWFQYYKGMACKDFMQALGYDAMALGNHEFDFGTRNLRNFLQNISFPVLSANLDASNDPFIRGLFQQSVILQLDGTKVGIVGYILESTKSLVATAEHLEFKNVMRTLKADVTLLKQVGVHIIIALGHQGYDLDKKMAETLEDVDLIIGGHDNAFLYTGTPPSGDVPIGEYPTLVTQTSGHKVLIVQAGQYGKYLGFLNLTFDEMGDVSSWAGNPVLLDSSITQDPELVADIETRKDAFRNIYENIIGQTRVLIDGERQHCRTRECNAGNFITDALHYQILTWSTMDNTSWSESSIAFVNSGCIRSSLPPGDVNYGDILMVHPFGNLVERIQLKGRHLLEALEHSVSEYEPADPHGRFLQFSGIRVKFDVTRPNGSRVREVKVRCSRCKVPIYEALNNDTIYSILTLNFIVNGGDGFTMITDNLVKRDRIDVLLTDLVMSHLSSRSPVVPGLDGRIEFVKDEPPVLCPTCPTLTCPTVTCPACPTPQTPTCPQQKDSASACDPFPLLAAMTVLIAFVLHQGQTI